MRVEAGCARRARIDESRRSWRTRYRAVVHEVVIAAYAHQAAGAELVGEAEPAVIAGAVRKRSNHG